MGSVYLRGKSYVGKYKDENDKWIRKTLGRQPIINKTIAKEILKEIERKVMLGQHDMVKTKIPILQGVCKELSVLSKRRKTKKKLGT